MVAFSTWYAPEKMGSVAETFRYGLPFLKTPSYLCQMSNSFFQSLILPRWDVISIILSVFLMTYTYIEAKSNYHRGSILILRYVDRRVSCRLNPTWLLFNQLPGAHRRILHGTEQRIRGHAPITQNNFPVCWTIFRPLMNERIISLHFPVPPIHPSRAHTRYTLHFIPHGRPFTSTFSSLARPPPHNLYFLSCYAFIQHRVCCTRFLIFVVRLPLETVHPLLEKPFSLISPSKVR